MWNESDNEILDRILETIIPPSKDGKIQSANNIIIRDKIKNEVINDNKLKSLYQHGMQYFKQMLILTAKELNNIDLKKFTYLIRKLEDQKPEFFNYILRQTYIAYYIQPSIRTHYGLSANPPHPEGYNVISDTVEEISLLVDPVIKRGSCYREYNEIKVET